MARPGGRLMAIVHRIVLLSYGLDLIVDRAFNTRHLMHSLGVVLNTMLL